MLNNSKWKASITIDFQLNPLLVFHQEGPTEAGVPWASYDDNLSSIFLGQVRFQYYICT